MHNFFAASPQSVLTVLRSVGPLSVPDSTLAGASAARLVRPVFPALSHKDLCIIRAQRGFSLFELLIVLILVSLTAGLVLPSFSRGLSGLELETSGRDLITRMKQARSRAIAKQEVSRIILVPSEESPDYYVLADEFEQELNRFLLPERVSIELPEDQFEEPFVRISFYPNGRSSGGSFYLLNETREIAVWVDPITGFARVLKEELD
jgi:prepilin-type N-terminal cleavage/methylation domain-containing protein